MAFSEEQAMEALDEANRVRMARADVKRKLRDCEIGLEQAFEHPDCQKMRAFDLLKAQMYWGPLKTINALSRLGIREGRRVAMLSPREREALVCVSLGLDVPA